MKELDVALDIIRKAGAEVMRLYDSFAQIADAPADISTEADKASQEIILKQLHREFPADGLCAEEKTATLASAASNPKRHWVVDPIDGTRGFARKNGEFSIMIGLVEGGSVIVGVVYEPAIDRITYACQGEGCFVQQPASQPAKRCRVTATKSYDVGTLAMSRSQGSKGEAMLLGAFGASKAIQTYSAGIKLAQVARGEADCYVGDYMTMHDWDICAGQILVEEAGGKMTTLAGEPVAYRGTGDAVKGKGFVATNGILHAATIEVLKAGKVKFE